MTIYCIYQEEPDFPATDQQPDAKRYLVNGWWVDANEEPTAEEVENMLRPTEPQPPLNQAA